MGIKRFWLLLVTLIGALVLAPLGLAASGADRPVAGPAVCIEGRPVTNWEIPPQFYQGCLLVPVRQLAPSLGAVANWDGSSQEVVVSSPKVTVRFQIGSTEAAVNGEKVILPAPPIIREARTLVPLRFLAHTLGWRVKWNANTQTADLLGLPERAYINAFPGRLAFTNDNCLWLLDGSTPGAAPVQVTEKGAVEILGWSPDGQWLAYLWRETTEHYSGKPYLWVVRFDGSNNYQVDPRPVMGEPAWSPVANVLSYSTQGPGGGYAPDMNLKLATIEEGGTRVVRLLPDKSELVEDLAWAPDGQSLAIALPRTGELPWRIERLGLTGERTLLLEGAEKGAEGEDEYLRVPWGLTWSPNGRYLAFYLLFNSGSLNADGVPLQVLDLEQHRLIDLGTSLPYRQWLAWSPDGNSLAFIQGAGREATENKHLAVVSLPEGEVASYGQPGTTDSQPCWLPLPWGPGVLFVRGLEREGETKTGTEALSGDQRIWLAKEGQVRPLTQGTPDTADCYPYFSSATEKLYFLRLNSATSGTFCLQPLQGGRVLELVRHISGSPGFYGNYHPAWVSFYYLGPEEGDIMRFTGKLVESYVEGRHLELETREVEGGFLVVVPTNKESAAYLEKYLWQEVTLEGTLSHKPNIYMRGPLLRVETVLPAALGEPRKALLTEFSIEPPDFVVKGKDLSRVEIWAVPTGTGIMEKDLYQLGLARLQGEVEGQQIWAFPLPRETIMATHIFAQGYDADGQLVGRIYLPFTGVTEINQALGTGEE
ncbi:stalk domain-containing protein [Moorellaceae bacterium AZ2]